MSVEPASQLFADYCQEFINLYITIKRPGLFQMSLVNPVAISKHAFQN